MKAKYFNKEKNNKVKCILCPNNCTLSEGKIGPCKARKNDGGKLISLTYGKVVAMNVDPIEKKPLYHFLPGSKTFSIGTNGCNLKCRNCQNFSISQKVPEREFTKNISAEEIVDMALKNQCESISFTYNEPTVFYEYMLEIAKLSKIAGLKNVMVTNGYINKEPLLELIPYLDAVNIDLKVFDNKIYKSLFKGKLKPVLKTIKTLKKNNVWIELTNLIIPGYSDNVKKISKMIDWFTENNMQTVPLHFSRFFPTYKLGEIEPTNISSILEAGKIARDKGMQYVYYGNMHENMSETICPECKSSLILRKTYSIESININSNKCNNCNTKIPGIWMV